MFAGSGIARQLGEGSGRAQLMSSAVSHSLSGAKSLASGWGSCGTVVGSKEERERCTSVEDSRSGGDVACAERVEECTARRRIWVAPSTSTQICASSMKAEPRTEGTEMVQWRREEADKEAIVNVRCS